MRKESADTQEHESCWLNDVEVDIDENQEESSFVPRVVRELAGWYEPKSMCDRHCWKKWGSSKSTSHP